jgi:hypothetical protein
MKYIANNYEQVTEKTPENRERIITRRSQKKKHLKKDSEQLRAGHRKYHLERYCE